MTLAHHDAADCNQRPCGEAVLLRAQQRGNHHVAAGLQPAVRLQHHAAAQVVHHQRLVCLGNTELRQAGVLDVVRGEAPVPPESPEIRMWSECALATPAAMVPTPTSLTSLRSRARPDSSS